MIRTSINLGYVGNFILMPNIVSCVFMHAHMYEFLSVCLSVCLSIFCAELKVFQLISSSTVVS